MTSYRYLGFSNNGAKKRGIIDAANTEEARQRLRGDGIKILTISEVDLRTSKVSVLLRRVLPVKVNLERFFSDIALLLDAGLGLDRALKAIASDNSNGANTELAKNILDALSAGKPPSQAFELVGNSNFGVGALIASGEQSGKLSIAFRVIAGDLERNRIRQSEITEAIAYPAFLLLMVFVSLMVVTFFLVPAILPIFEGAARPAPMMIRALDWVRNVIIDWGAIASLVALLAILATFKFVRIDQRRERFSTFILAMPIIGRLVEKRGLSRYLNSLALLLGNGVEMPKALEFAASTCLVKAYSAKLRTVRERVMNGTRLPDALGESAIFPTAVVSLAAIGDEVNNLPSVLLRSAELLEEESARAQRQISALITPVITIFMGILIGGLVISVMSALLSINDLSLQ